VGAPGGYTGFPAESVVNENETKDKTFKFLFSESLRTVQHFNQFANNKIQMCAMGQSPPSRWIKSSGFSSSSSDEGLIISVFGVQAFANNGPFCGCWLEPDDHSAWQEFEL